MNDFSIFSNDYISKVYVLGGVFNETVVMGNINAIINTIYLKSHGNKYELKFEGIVDKSISEYDISISCKKVDNFTLQNNGMHYACDGEKEGELLLKITSNKIYNIDKSVLSQSEIKMLDDFIIANSNKSDDVVITNAFVFSYHETEDKEITGILKTDSKKFTRCSPEELCEILNIKKELQKNKNNFSR